LQPEQEGNVEQRNTEMPARVIGRDLSPDERAEGEQVIEHALAEFKRQAVAAAGGGRCARCQDPTASLSTDGYCADCFVALRVEAWSCTACRAIRAGQAGWCGRHRLGGAEGEQPTHNPEFARRATEIRQERQRATCAFGCGATKDELIVKGHRPGCRGGEIERDQEMLRQNEQRARATAAASSTVEAGRVATETSIEHERRTRCLAGYRQLSGPVWECLRCRQLVLCSDENKDTATEAGGAQQAADAAMFAVRDRLLTMTIGASHVVDIVEMIEGAEKADRLAHRMRDRARRPQDAVTGSDEPRPVVRNRLINKLMDIVNKLPKELGALRELVMQAARIVDPSVLEPPVMETIDEPEQQPRLRAVEEAMAGLQDGDALALNNSYGEILRILLPLVGESGESEGAADVVTRIIRERNSARTDLVAVDEREQAALGALWDIVGHDFKLPDGQPVSWAAVKKMRDLRRQAERFEMVNDYVKTRSADYDGKVVAYIQHLLERLGELPPAPKVAAPTDP
jgi:hypothetical protein